ncbi:hypothetical protein JG486_31220 (plasmid) [Bacillus mycoides]|nr:hypothetical protein JG486_31220 [Bacillus mycoides]
MFKTLLAGTFLSTGLLAGGAVGAEDVKSDQKVEKAKYSETIERPEGTDSQEGKNVSTKEGKDFDKSKPVLIQKNEGGTIFVKQGDEIPKDLEKYDSKEFNLLEESI